MEINVEREGEVKGELLKGVGEEGGHEDEKEESPPGFDEGEAIVRGRFRTLLNVFCVAVAFLLVASGMFPAAHFLASMVGRCLGLLSPSSSWNERNFGDGLFREDSAYTSVPSSAYEIGKMKTRAELMEAEA
uniref:Uncharacterized protein n=1 Tax=Compsopogon caeruleus TaxID=31354 RepID=A0A7S1XDB0_9RHOD